MRVSRITAYTVAALLGTAAVACVPVTSASAATSSAAQPGSVRVVAGHNPLLINQPYWEYATGYGATLADAKADAENILNSGCTYGTNSNPTGVSNGQESDGSWWAYMKALCSYE
ncbi:hypothetical protein GXW82_11915 [Streptacidiphilus sp. 4-A2]|nr:hypothetical protein [Streptacidiphilus sp. 4-A2]